MTATAGTPRLSPWRAFPADPADWFSADEIAKAKRYQRPLTAVSAVDQAVRLAIALTVVGTGVPGRVLEGLSLPGWWARFAALCVLTTGFGIITTLPTSMWRSLVHDRRWGFSTQTLSGLLLDEAKGFVVVTLLLLVFGLPAWAVVRATPLWWVYAWLIFGAFTTVVGVLYPVVIAPVFNRYEPLDSGDLREELLRLGPLVGADISEILVEDSSKRTTKGNAYVSGLGRTRRVVLYDTMVGHAPKELRTIVAHELGHWKLRHIAKTVPVSIALSWLTFAALDVVLSNPRVLRFAHIHRLGDPVGFLLFILAFPAVGRLTGLVQSWMSRSFEREADLFALRSTGDAVNFARAMRSLYTTNLSDLAPSVWRRVNATHPPAAERLAMAAAWDGHWTTMHPGGEGCRAT